MPLKPCPFCGREVEIVPTNVSDSSNWVRHIDGAGPKCALEFSAFFLDCDLAEAWNTRTPSTDEESKP